MDPKQAILDLQRNPDHIFQLDGLLFERVVAELLARFGWRVNVTPPSRDGGYDILGITTDSSGLQSSWVVECKRYAPTQKIGVDFARSIVGVKEHFGIPNALIVTTSSFTKDARAFAAAESALHLIDLPRLRQWISQYAPPQDASYEQTRHFSSCFISYSFEDKSFAEKLAGRLREAGVPIWFAQEDIKPGDKIHDQVKRAIASADRLLVVLSHNSMSSNWVRTELATAVKREKREQRQLLFPIALAPISEIKEWECFDGDSGIDIAREIREYYLPDFSQWTDEAVFAQQVDGVLKALAHAEHNESFTYPLLPFALFYTLRHTTTPEAIAQAFKDSQGYKSLKSGILKLIGTVPIGGHGLYNSIDLSAGESHCRLDSRSLQSLIDKHSGLGESAIKLPLTTKLEFYFPSSSPEPSLTLERAFLDKPRSTRAVELFDDVIFQDVFDTGWEVTNPSKGVFTITDVRNARICVQMTFLSFHDINLQRPPRLHNLHLYFGKSVPHIMFFKAEQLERPVVTEDPEPIAKWDLSNIGMTARELLMRYEFCVDDELFSKQVKQIDTG